MNCWRKVQIQSVSANKQEERWLLTWTFYTNMIVDIMKQLVRLGKNMIIEYKCVTQVGTREDVP